MRSELMLLRTYVAGFWALLRDQRGQAMVEYSTIVMFGSVVGGAAAFGYILPALLNAINSYLGSIYYILNMPLP